MNRALAIAVAVGASIGMAVVTMARPDWTVITGVSALYTGWSYFVARNPSLLSREGLTFEKTADSIGHAVGIFGASVFGIGVFSTGGVFFVGYLGVIGFLLTAAAAYEDEPRDRRP
ncbi:hypothetical protein [Natrinema sp. 74]|uniref:hypothetical protein n=1 Tax=Natrinema sp. 74 TaxID=3384159 RepID=UPI0038D3C746